MYIQALVQDLKVQIKFKFPGQLEQEWSLYPHASTFIMLIFAAWLE